MPENSNIITPQGVTYVNKETYEYQLFPEEYFSGADLSIYFGDIWVDEITGLEFTILEKVKPIYGYASRTWDWVSRGNRIVAGSFRIAFKEAGYLNAILSHLGMLTYQDDQNPIAPKLAFYMHGDHDAPFWYGACQERIEDVLNRYHIGNSPAVPADPTNPNRAVAQGFKILAVERPGQNLKYGDTDATTGGWVSKMQKALKERYPFACLSPMSVTGWPTLKVGSSGDYVKKLQQRLKDYWCDPGAIDGIFGQKTRQAVVNFQTRAKLTADGIVGDKTKAVLARGFAVDGDFGSVTRLAVIIMQSHEKISTDGIVGPQTAAKLWPDAKSSPSTPSETKKTLCSPKVTVDKGKAYAWSRDLTSVLGIPDSKISFDPNTQIVTIDGKQFKAWKVEAGKSYLWTREVGEAFGWKVTWDNVSNCVVFVKGTPGTGGSTGKSGPGTPIPGPVDDPTADDNLAAEPRLASLEKEIWGRRFSPHAEEYNKREPYFYRGDYPSKLRQKGYDIYIVYGPLAQFAIAKKEIFTDQGIYGDAQLGNKVPFNTTVKAIRNIQFKSSGQILDASGNPIEEVYTFLAQDLD